MKRKNYPSGFVPIDFKSLGKILLPISMAMMTARTVDYLIGTDLIPTAVLFIGIGFLVVSVYLLLTVPKE